MTVQEIIDALQTIEDKSKKMALEYDNRNGGRYIHSIHMTPGFVYVSEESSENYHNYNPNHLVETEEEYKKRLVEEQERHYKEYKDYCHKHGFEYNAKIHEYNRYTPESLEHAVKFWKRKKEDTQNEVLVYAESNKNI